MYSKEHEYDCPTNGVGKSIKFATKIYHTVRPRGGADTCISSWSIIREVQLLFTEDQFSKRAYLRLVVSLISV